MRNFVMRETMYSAFLILLLFGTLNSSLSQRSTTISLNHKEPDDIIRIIPPEEKFDTDCNEKSTFDLSMTGIKNLSLKNFNNIRMKCLYLQGNEITDLPSEIFKSANFANLTYLNLANNFLNLTNFPSLDGHENLKALVLDGNKGLDTELNPFGSLPHLRALYLRKNHLTNKINWEELFLNFPRLTHLYLSDNDINIIAFLIIRPVSITHLHLERNVFAVGTNLGNYPVWKNLTHLYIDGHNEDILKFLGSGENMPNLQVLSVKNCRIKNRGIYDPQVASRGSYSFKNLRAVDLSSNEISGSQIMYDIPDILLKEVQNLSLSHNLLTDIPMQIRLENLRVYSLSYNLIANITPRYLEYSGNLRIFSLRGNRISHIPTDTFSFMKNLEILDLAENRLSSLPPLWIKRLNNLRYLNVNSNLFHSAKELSIPPDHKLEHLHLRNNKIENFTAEFLQTIPKGSTVYISAIY